MTTATEPVSADGVPWSKLVLPVWLCHTAPGLTPIEFSNLMPDPNGRAFRVFQSKQAAYRHVAEQLRKQARGLMFKADLMESNGLTK